MDNARLLVDPPARGAWNMAVDEVLLESAAAGATTLRFYAWSEPTLSLGYFQSAADRESHVASRDCPLVRRASGGGAIVHDCELTYSFATPSREHFGTHAAAMYDAFHHSLIESLAALGIVANLCAAADASFQRRNEREPFLCFQRHTAGDVLMGGDKIAGSAQRRNRGGMLQHGSILLAKSARAPELPGIHDLANESITVAHLVDAWIEPLTRRLAVKPERQILTQSENHRAQILAEQRFASADWNARR